MTIWNGKKMNERVKIWHTCRNTYRHSLRQEGEKHENQRQVSQFLLRNQRRRNSEPKIDPKKTALLLVDLQNEFVSRDYGEALEFKASGEWERWIPFHDRLDDIVF